MVYGVGAGNTVEENSSILFIIRVRWLPSATVYTASKTLHRQYRPVLKSRIPLRYLVADTSEAGRGPAASWNLDYHLAR